MNKLFAVFALCWTSIYVQAFKTTITTSANVTPKYRQSTVGSRRSILPILSQPKATRISVQEDDTLQKSTSTSSQPTTTNVSILNSYEYNGFHITYRYLPASSGYENESPILLIHPVGIGMSSWFWEPLLEEFSRQGKHPAIYAPNLIGCGISEGSDPWDPQQQGLFVPLDWVKGCEAMMDHVTDETNLNDDNVKISQQQHHDSDDTSTTKEENVFGENSFRNLLSKKIFASSSSSPPWTVVTQGGLAPIGVILAARNSNKVKQLIMASPPTWKDMTTSVPQQELNRNYNFLKHPIWGNLAFQFLESRSAIAFFSNQFLFSNQSDDRWLDYTEQEYGKLARPPVQVFNAGFCLNRSLEQELRNLENPTIITEGIDDKRQRPEYVQNMINCRTESLPGKNVVPWEYPREFAELLNRQWL